MDGNPWQVDSLQDFLCLKCPECTFDTQEEENFQEHAIGNHPLSQVFFGTVKMEEGTSTVEECYVQNSDSIGEIDPLDSTESTKYMIDCEIELKDEFSNIDIDSKATDTCEAGKIQNENDKLIVDKSNISDKKSVNMNRRKQILKPRNSEEYESSNHIKANKDPLQGDSVHEEIRPFMCSQCSKRFSQNCTLTRHMKLVHDKVKPFLCTQCPSRFPQKSSLKKHFEVVHEGEKWHFRHKEKHVCSTCGKDFKTTQHLNRHILSVHEKVRNFNCLLCDSSFYEKSALTTHIESVHEGKRPYSCPFCESAFSLKWGLNNHIQNVHEGKKTKTKKEKTFKCDDCDSIFALKTGLITHVDQVHKKIRRFLCTLCDHGTYYKQDLKRHVEIVHEKKKSHKCPICDARFGMKQKLNGHISAVHDKLKPFLCSFCSYSCSQSSNLKKHMTSVHKIKPGVK